MRLIRHRFRPLTARRVYCICGYPKSNQWHQGFTNEEDAEFSRAWAPQPPSKPGTVNIIDLVHADLDARDRMGTKKYGTTLQAHNGRKPLTDAYQEALDLAMYLRQEIEEQRSVERASTRAICVTHQQLVAVITTVSEQARRDLQMEPARYVEQLASAILNLINGDQEIKRPSHVTHKQVMDVIDRVMGERHGSQWFNATNNQDAVAQAIVELVENGRDLDNVHTHDAAVHERTWDAVFAACVSVIGDDTGSHATGIEIADRVCKALKTKPAKYGNG